MNNCRKGATPAPQLHLASPVAAEAQQCLELQGLIWRPSLSQSNCTGAKVFPVAIMGSKCHMDHFYWMLLKNWLKLNKQMLIKVLCHCKSKFTFLGVSFQVQESLVAGEEVLVHENVIIFLSSFSSHLLVLQQTNTVSWLLNCCI